MLEDTLHVQTQCLNITEFSKCTIYYHNQQHVQNVYEKAAK